MSEFFINLHYLPEVIKNYFGDGTKHGVKIHYSFEPTILGTAGGLKKFSAEGGSPPSPGSGRAGASGGEDKLDNEFFLIYGDTFSLVDYSKMREAWEKLPQGAIGMQRMAKTEDYADADVAEVGDGGLFLKIHPKPHTEKYANAYGSTPLTINRMRGVFILRKKILSYIPPGMPYEIGKQLLPDIVSRGEKFYSYECDDYSKGIDTIEKLRDVEEYLRSRKVS